MNARLPITVAGSYPLVWDYEGKYRVLIRGIRDALGDTLGDEGPFQCMSDFLVANAILDQLFASSAISPRESGSGVYREGDLARLAGNGIDIVSTGQHRLTLDGNMCVPMLKCFDDVILRQEEGVHLAEVGRGARFNAEVYGRTLLRDYAIASATLDYINKRIGNVTEHKRLKLALTGPLTLLWGEGVVYDKNAESDILAAFSDGIIQMVNALRDRNLLRHVHHISIDEPLVAGDNPNANLMLIQRLGQLFASLTNDTSDSHITILHVCGSVNWAPIEEIIGQIGPELTGVHVELAGRGRAHSLREFLDRVKEHWRDDRADLRLCAGLVDTNSFRVENEEEIASFLDSLLSYFKFDTDARLLASPNCGLRGLPLRIARRKLESLCSGTRLALNRLAVNQERPSNTSHILPDAHPGFYDFYRRMEEGPRKRAFTEFISDCADRLDNTAQALPEMTMTYFTVHTAKHAREVLGFMDVFVKRLRLSEDERLLCLLAAFAHDVGLYISPAQYLTCIDYSRKADFKLFSDFQSDVRKEHAQRSVDLIRDKAELGSHLRPFDDSMVDALCALVASHRKGVPLPDRAAFPRVRIQLLAALTKFCDECDMSRRRLPPRPVYTPVLSRPFEDLTPLEQESRPHLLRLALIEKITIRLDARTLIVDLTKRLESEEERQAFERCREDLTVTWREGRDAFAEADLRLEKLETYHDGINCGPNEAL